DEADAALHQPAGQQALPAEGGAAAVVQAVQLLDVFRLAAQVHRLGRRRLHLEGQLVAGDAGGQGRVVAVPGPVLVVEGAQVIQQPALRVGAGGGRAGQVEDGGAPGAEGGALEVGRHVAARPVLGAAD